MKEYSLTKRKKENGSFFYVRFKDDTGTYGTAKSVETLRKKLGESDCHHITRIPEAVAIVEKAIAAGLDGLAKLKDPILVEYLDSFWNYDGEYATKQNKKNKNSIGKTHCKNMKKLLTKHVLPSETDTPKELKIKLPKNLNASQLKCSHIEKIQTHVIIDLGLSNKTWSLIQTAISVPIHELMKKGIVRIDPFEKLEKYTVSSTRTTRGSLTSLEVNTLVQGIKERIDSHKLDSRIGLAIVLACATGMRLQEVQALRDDSIEIPMTGNLAIIHINAAYSRLDGFKSTKTKKDRNVTISKGFASALLSLANENGLIFWSDINEGLPIAEVTLEKNFNKELVNCKVMTEKERQERHVSFHSMRHFANTEAITRVGRELTNEFIGHDDDQMATRYDHPDNSRALAIGTKVGSLIPDLWEERMEA